MKRTLLVTITLMLFSFVSVAQQTKSIGPKAGINFSSLRGVDNASVKTGAQVGLAFVFSANENFGINIEALYSGEGAWLSATNLIGNTTRDTDLRLHYFRVPVQAVLFLRNLDDHLRPKIALGPSVGFLFGVKESSSDEISDTEFTDLGGFDRFDVGPLGTIGFNYRIADATWLNFDISYYLGLLDAGKYSGSSYGPSLSVGLAFGIGGGGGSDVAE